MEEKTIINFFLEDGSYHSIVFPLCESDELDTNRFKQQYIEIVDIISNDSNIYKLKDRITPIRKWEVLVKVMEIVLNGTKEEVMQFLAVDLYEQEYGGDIEDTITLYPTDNYDYYSYIESYEDWGYELIEIADVDSSLDWLVSYVDVYALGRDNIKYGNASLGPWGLVRIKE